MALGSKPGAIFGQGTTPPATPQVVASSQLAQCSLPTEYGLLGGGSERRLAGLTLEQCRFGSADIPGP